MMRRLIACSCGNAEAQRFERARREGLDDDVRLLHHRAEQQAAGRAC